MRLLLSIFLLGLLHTATPIAIRARNRVHAVRTHNEQDIQESHECKPGGYYDSTANKCIGCPLGYYAIGTHATECTKCPYGTFTPHQAWSQKCQEVDCHGKFGNAGYTGKGPTCDCTGPGFYNTTELTFSPDGQPKGCLPVPCGPQTGTVLELGHCVCDAKRGYAGRVEYDKETRLVDPTSCKKLQCHFNWMPHQDEHDPTRTGFDIGVSLFPKCAPGYSYHGMEVSCSYTTSQVNGQLKPVEMLRYNNQRLDNVQSSPFKKDAYGNNIIAYDHYWANRAAYPPIVATGWPQCLPDKSQA